MPESQESVDSVISSTFSAPALASTSSNVSDHDAASPAKSNGPPGHSEPAQNPIQSSPNGISGQAVPKDAHRIDIPAANAPQTGHTTASSVPPVSPTSQGFKRGADGLVKGDMTATSLKERTFAHKRTKSMDTHSSTRIGEVCSDRSRHILWLANAYTAFRTTQDSSLVRHGEGTEWLGETVARGIGRKSIATWIAQLCAGRVSNQLWFASFY